MSLNSDTLFWFRGDQYLHLLSAACLAEKEKKHQFNSLGFTWPGMEPMIYRTLTTGMEPMIYRTLTITPLMLFLFDRKK